MKKTGTLTKREISSQGKRTENKPSSPPVRGIRRDGAETFFDQDKGLTLCDSIVEYDNDGIFAFDEQYRIEFANPGVSRITGFSNSDLLTMTADSLLGEPNRFLLEDLFSRPDRYEEKRCTEIQLVRSTGELKEAEICLVLAEPSHGARKAFAYLRDITESKGMERRVREASQELEKIAEMGNDGIIIFDQDFKIIFANQIASEITGISKRELIGRNFFTVIGKQDKEFLEGTVTCREGIGQKLCMDMTIVTPKGDLKDAEVCIASTRSGGGEVKTYAYIRDITDRKKWERDLRDSEQRLRTLFERVRHGLFISSREGKFLDCNQALLDMLGYSSKEEFLSIDIAQDLYVNPEVRRIFQERVAREGYVKDMEVQFKSKTGACVTVLLTGYPILNEKGEVSGYEGINLDISERKRIENELREANEFFTNLIESSVDGIIATDMKGNIFIFNKGAEALTGYTAEEVVGKIHITEIYPRGMAKEVMKMLRSPEYGGVGKLTPVQFTVVDRTGDQIPIQLSASLIYDGAGNEIATVGIFTDLRPRLTMEKKLQETHLQLVSSEKMASLGKLAAGIAHEINNPLGGILIYASLIMEDLPEDDRKRGDLGRIVQEAGRCKEIVKSLLEFARQTEPKMEPTDINRAITEGLFFLENQALFYNIQIIKRLDPFLPLVQGNAGQLKQVFINIIVNAAEAMHGTGSLTITSYPSRDRKSVFLDFTDTGEGISEENLARIFDPFFTTKEVGKGTGLGLSTSYGIVKSHDGTITVKTKVGAGTTFVIELPASQESQPALEGKPMLGMK
jgi:PAS domain S-box-containing protein